MTTARVQRLEVSPAAALTAVRVLSQRRDRDPRAAPVSIDHNVSIVETCRFYGVADALSTCRVPRSCQDCLALPGCMISMDGRCENTSESFNTRAFEFDYRTKLTTAQPHGTAYDATLVASSSATYFFSDNATYCRGTDPICDVCRARFRTLAAAWRKVGVLDNQFCVGVNGCVCVAVCEIPTLLATKAFDAECGQSQPLYVMPHRPELPAFSSVHRDPRTPPLVKQVMERTVDETCGFYGDVDLRGCREPRPCAACLHRENCMISGAVCSAMDDYDPTRDFRSKSMEQFPFAMQFPSTNTSYCPPSDATCAACRDKFQATAASLSDNSMVRFNGKICVGEGGCVCIEACENRAFFLETAADTICRGASGRSNGNATTLAACALGVSVLLGFFFWWMHDKGRTTRDGVETIRVRWRHMLDQAPALHLDLFGWRRFQRELRDKEDAILNGAEDTSPVARPHVDFEYSEATAPEFDDDESTAPTMMDPNALASAPVYRRSRGSWTNEGDGRSASVPSAPEL